MTRREYREWLRWVDDVEQHIARLPYLPPMPRAPRLSRKSEGAIRLVTEQLVAVIRAAQAIEAGASRGDALAVFDEHSPLTREEVRRVRL